MAISLGTRRYREAEHLAVVADEAFEKAFLTMMETAQPSRLAELMARLTMGQTAAEIAAELEAAVAVVESRARMDGPGTGAAIRRALALERAFGGDAAPRTRLLRAASPELTISAERAMAFLAGEMFPAAAKAATEPVPVKSVQAAVPPSPVAPSPVTATREAIRATAPEVVPTMAAQESVPAKEAEAAPSPAEPLASAVLVEFKAHREKKGHPLRMADQACSTARRFIAVAGDRPLRSYERGDILGFTDALRRLPKHHGKPPNERDRTPADLIKKADDKAERTGKAVPRLKEVTVQRQVSELSAFFLFGVNHRPQLLHLADHDEMFKRHEFGEVEGERDQREPWPDADLKALSMSPLYQGCDPRHRWRPGKQILRDALFWLPLMEQFGGARLEEMADLYARDIKDDHGPPYFDIREHHERADGHKRRLKTKPSKRKVPVHPELLRLGFLEYVRWRAPNPGDPVFPDLLPQGRDGRRGPRFTSAFRYYRRRIGLYREGMDGHALRHNANTRLRGVITDKQQQRHVNYMFGWGGGGMEQEEKNGGGEGERRYDQGPPPREAVKTLALLRYPGIDFSHLYGWNPPSVG